MESEKPKKEEKESKGKNQMGGAKGGTRYPKDNLEKAVQYAIKLVSKTHTGPQPATTILPGVFGSKTWIGEIRVSSARQYGFLSGNKDGYTATELAKTINSTPKDELQPLLAQACLKIDLFKTIYDTYVGDVVNDSKLRQQILNLKVHPENVDECLKIFKESLIYAGLAESKEEDKIFIKTNIQVAKEKEEESESESEEDNDEYNEDNGLKDKSIKKKSSTGTNISVNIDVNSSMDPEKLEKFLKLLKGYGAI